MTIENEQITPADAAIVSSGTGTKGPEERDLPASLKEEMDLCLQILREVLGEFDEKLLAKFDEVREHALNASAERFSGILTDTNLNQDDLQKVVDIIDTTAGPRLHHLLPSGQPMRGELPCLRAAQP